MTTKKQGFTIIEVVLVLAIAGLIFLMVFIALPALQRSQRDTQRRNDLSRLETAISNYQTNNKGTIPDLSTSTAAASFLSGYVTSGGDTFVDPSGNAYVVGSYVTLPTTFDGTNPNIKVTVGSVCSSSEGVLTSGQGARKLALQMKLEGNGIACINN